MKICCELCGYPTDEWVCIDGKYYCIDCAEEIYKEKEDEC